MEWKGKIKNLKPLLSYGAICNVLGNKEETQVVTQIQRGKKTHTESPLNRICKEKVHRHINTSVSELSTVYLRDVHVA